MGSIGSDEWRLWLDHPCSKAMLSKLVSTHTARARTWCNITDATELIRAQASYRITGDLLDVIKGGSKWSMREICTGAGLDPDQLPE